MRVDLDFDGDVEDSVDDDDTMNVCMDMES